MRAGVTRFSGWKGATLQGVVSCMWGIWCGSCTEPALHRLAACARSLQVQQCTQSYNNMKHFVCFKTKQEKRKKDKRKKEKKKKTLLLCKYKSFFPMRCCPDDQREQQGSRWWINVVEVAGMFEGFIEFNVSFFFPSPQRFSVVWTIPVLMYGPADVSVVLFIHLPFWWNSSYFLRSLPFSFLI